MNRIITRTYKEHSQGINNLNETLFHNANGYIGVRGSLEEGVPNGWNTMRGTYINGFYDVIPMKQAENLCNFVDKKDTMVNVADTMTIKCTVDGDNLDMTTGKLFKHERTLNMDAGYTDRLVEWESPKGTGIDIHVRRMTSFVLLPLFSIEYSITAKNKDTQIVLQSSHIAGVTNYCDPTDPRLAAESLKNLEVVVMEMKDGAGYAVSQTSVSKLKMCSLSENSVSFTDANGEKIDVSYDKEIISKADRIDEDFTFTLHKGESVTLTKINIYEDSLREADCVEAAYRDLRKVKDNTLAYFYEKQADYLKEFWKNSEMTILGDDASSDAVAFNMYELLQAAAKDKYCSIAAKGLSGEGYEGHYFWDTEVFILPFFIMTNPSLAKEILKYRYYTLDKARENAKLLGHKRGALYPWRTITGAECSGYFVSGSAAYHINADIAYAIISYYLTTGDIDFIADVGEEILVETARLWLDLGNYNANGDFVLNDVTGPDEYTCMINNNYYTNCAAKYNISWAVKLYERLIEEGKVSAVASKTGITVEELGSMKAAADKMLLLYDKKLGINPQDDSFLSKPIWDLENTPKEDFPLLLHYHPLHLYRYQVCKQADTVLSYFMFEEMQDIETMRKSYEYYEKITTHDSSLSTCAFSIVASRLGMHDKGYAYFGDSTKLDLENTHNNTKDGVHTANMGGCYMAVVNGFAGVRIREDGMYIAPFVPADWEGYRFVMTYMGRLLSINVDRSDVKVSLLEGEPIEIYIYGKKYALSDRNNEISVKIDGNCVAVINS